MYVSVYDKAHMEHKFRFGERPLTPDWLSFAESMSQLP